MKTLNFYDNLEKFELPCNVLDIIKNSSKCIYPHNRQELINLAMGGKDNKHFNVCYETAGKGKVLEATTVRCKNGVAVNYPEEYMRRRDPECMVVADNDQTDKVRFKDRFSSEFEPLRQETFNWLKGQNLSITLFILGGLNADSGQGAMLIAPDNAGFFIAGLADLQGMVDPTAVPENFRVRSVIYLAPPFRHTHFNGKQVVVHNRLEDVHEVFSYNLYPGPSAKKGVYGVLLTIGEEENWPTLHASTVEVVTPYDNITTIMHEGASGGGKSEMLEYVHRQGDGRLLLGKNILSGEERHLVLNQACELHPVTDDMAMCHPSDWHEEYLMAKDAEEAWFVRVNHILRYGTDPHLEEATIHPDEPLIFLNIQGTADSTCLIWEHIEDKPGKRCPNPRVILPRKLVHNVVNGPVEVMIRSFGLRTPPCTKENPSYGILGYLHLLPSSLAWLWRLVAPRGYDNPSITDSEAMSSEGVGSYWPFATGRVVDHANILLRQIVSTPKVRYTLTPNQYVGAWKTGFMPQWIAREYLGRRGLAKFNKNQLSPSRCPLLGYAFNSMQVEGTIITPWFLKVETQPEVDLAGYDAGAKMLNDFFKNELQKFLHPDLDKLGKDIINCCLDDGTVEDYEKLMYGVLS